MKQLRFLVSRIDRIGDVVLSTPIPREIKKKYPDSFIAVLVTQYTKDIYANNPHVDEILTYDNIDGSDKSFWNLAKEIRHFKFTHAFMLLPQERLNYILFFAGIGYRVGVGHKLYQILTFAHFVDRKKYIPLRHEADYCLDVIRKIGIDAENYFPEIHLSQTEKEAMVEFRKENLSSNEKLIGINVSSGNSAPNLNQSEYKRIINLLKNHKDYKVAVMDNNIPADLDNISNVIYPNKGNVLRKSILNLAALDVLISNSTGPMHICTALKIPTVSLFCPLTACSPKLWGPIGNRSEIILPTKNYCETQCPIDPKKCDYSNPGGLTAEFVVDKLNLLMKTLS